MVHTSRCECFSQFLQSTPYSCTFSLIYSTFCNVHSNFHVPHLHHAAHLKLILLFWYVWHLFQRATCNIAFDCCSLPVSSVMGLFDVEYPVRSDVFLTFSLDILKISSILFTKVVKLSTETLVWTLLSLTSSVPSW